MTTPLRPIDELNVAAARLKRAAPNSWKDFEAAFQKLTAEGVTRCVQSQSNQIFSNQGRAQQLTELRDLFANCVAEADKLEAKLKGAR